VPRKVEESVKLEQFVAFIFDLESIKKIFSPPVRFAHSRAQRTQRKTFKISSCVQYLILSLCPLCSRVSEANGW
jgi:hypothetical protein